MKFVKLKMTRVFGGKRGKGMEEVFIQKFKQRFSAGNQINESNSNDFLNVIQPVVTNDQIMALMLHVTEHEILDAVNNIGGLKAPGPDGLHAIFFQKCWSTVKNSVISLVKRFLCQWFQPKAN